MYKYKKVTYQFILSNRNWEFKLPGNKIYYKKCFGKTNADQVAKQLNASLNRNKKVDELAKGAINHILGFKKLHLTF